MGFIPKSKDYKDLLATAGISNADKPLDSPFDTYNQHHLKIDNEVADLMHEYLTLQHFLFAMVDVMGRLSDMPDPISKEEFLKLTAEQQLEYPKQWHQQLDNHLKEVKDAPKKEKQYISENFNLFDQIKYYRRHHRFYEIQNIFISWGMKFEEIIIMKRDDLPAYKRQFNILNDECSEIEFQSKIYKLDTPAQQNFVKYLYEMHKMDQMPAHSSLIKEVLNIDYSPSRIFRTDTGYHPLWDTLIIQPKQGYFQLNIKDK